MSAPAHSEGKSPWSRAPWTLLALGLCSCHHDFGFLDGSQVDGDDASGQHEQGSVVEASVAIGSGDAAPLDAPLASSRNDAGTADADGPRPPALWHTLAVGDLHICALHGSDNTVYCAGDNDWGQLGIGFTAPAVVDAPLVFGAVMSDIPGQLFSGVDTLAAGEQHTCAVKAGTIYCWGRSDSGESGSKTPVVTPVSPIVRPGAITGEVFELSSGGHHVCVRAAHGTFCWGGNEWSQISGAFNTKLVDLREIPGLANPKRLALGELFSLSISQDDDVECWGLTTSGQCGLIHGTPCPFGDYNSCVSEPQLVRSLPRVREIAAAGSHSCAISLADGKILCWGQNNSGQVGVPAPGDCAMPEQCQLEPTEVDLIEGADRLAVGGNHSCALVKREVWCWGEGSELGRGLAGKVSIPTPDRVLDNDGSVLTDIVDIAANTSETCARDAHGEIFCWGHQLSQRAVHLPWPDEASRSTP